MRRVSVNRACKARIFGPANRAQRAGLPPLRARPSGRLRQDAHGQGERLRTIRTSLAFIDECSHSAASSSLRRTLGASLDCSATQAHRRAAHVPSPLLTSRWLCSVWAIHSRRLMPRGKAERQIGRDAKRGARRNASHSKRPALASKLPQWRERSAEPRCSSCAARSAGPQARPARRQWPAAKCERVTTGNGHVWVLERRPRRCTRWAAVA